MPHAFPYLHYAEGDRRGIASRTQERHSHDCPLQADATDVVSTHDTQTMPQEEDICQGSNLNDDCSYDCLSRFSTNLFVFLTPTSPCEVELVNW